VKLGNPRPPLLVVGRVSDRPTVAGQEKLEAHNSNAVRCLELIPLIYRRTMEKSAERPEILIAAPKTIDTRFGWRLDSRGRAIG